MRSAMGLVVLGLTLLGQAAWASPCDAYGAETLAQGCDGITFEGCCLPNADLVWCEEGYVCLIRCSNNQPPYNTCGWNAQAGFYDCGQTGADPSGQHPIDCPACQPDCTGKECGNGGCVLMPDACGTCTECGETCVSGFCVFTACEGKECGPDGCGGECGTCPPGDVCVDGKCCTPQCEGKTCGPDGCGGKCGECAEGFYCDETQNCQPCSCGDKECGTDQCGNSCGTCAEGYYCDATGHCKLCTCEGKVCGQDGCGNPCGTCAAGQACLLSTGTCTTEVPYECQVHYTPGCPGCGCEACVCQLDPWCCNPSWYWDEFCVMECQYDCGGPACDEYCFPNCKDKVCGNDGCGGTCGSCPAGTYCGAGGKACIPCTCEGKQCGDDGCGNSCGTCPNPGDICANGICVPGGCAPTNTPGCGGCACEACVCAMDSYCCNTAWDSYCVKECSVDCGQNCPCVPSCQDKMCGDDGCGGTCPPGCKPGEFCKDGVCALCTCEGKECGDDGCGNSCGTCPENEICNEQGQCIGYYPESCLGLNEPSAPSCPSGLTFAGCCDGSGRVVWCEDDKLYCIDCAAYNTTCGWSLDGGFYDCGQTGPDPSGQNPYACVFGPCEPDCTGKMCGNGGCPGAGDVCGTCPEGLVCKDGICLKPGCQGITFEGCCDNNVVKWCEDDEIQSIDCSKNQPPNNVCGWKADAGYYDCGGSGEDPSGKNPIECPSICTPSCVGQECGNGGCPDYPDFLCGTCPAGKTCVNGKCVAGCEPNCTDKECGDDGCGGQCPPGCGANETCVNGKCEPICEPACAGKECGDDGCGGQCPPGCGSGQVCISGKCCTPNCQGKECGDDGCGGSCGVCQSGYVCTSEGKCQCVPNCQGKQCGDDGCGGSCGVCGAGEQCVDGKCELVPVGDVGPADAGPTTDTGGGKKGGGGGGCTTGLNQTMWPFALLLAAMAAIVGTRRKS